MALRQAEKLLAYMEQVGSVTVKEVRDNLGISNVQGRIYDIKHGIGCRRHGVLDETVSVVNREGEIVTIKRYWLDGTPRPAPLPPVTGRKRRRSRTPGDSDRRLRLVLERRRQKIRTLEQRLRDTETLLEAQTEELIEMAEDRRRTRRREISASRGHPAHQAELAFSTGASIHRDQEAPC